MPDPELIQAALSSLAPELCASGLERRIAGRCLYRDLDVRFAPASVTAIVGPNGSGKTTLLRELAGLLQPAAGTIHWRGESLTAMSPGSRARQLAYLPQATPLTYDLRVREVVMLGRTPFLPRFAGPTAADHEVVANALERVGLGDLSTRSLQSLSGGERQRVMLARMLATKAPLLLLDEPTAALDVGHALAFMELCRELASAGATVITALHDLDLARRCADAAIVLGTADGRALTGAANVVLTPAILGPLFAVKLREVGGHLLFERSLKR